MGIELRTSPITNRRHPVAKATRSAVATVLCDGVEGVRHRDDSGGIGNPSSREPRRITRSIPAFVVRQHSNGEVRIERAERRQHGRATCGVCGNGFTLRASQARAFVDDVDNASWILPMS